jgi:hypothetical protein
MPLPTAMSSRRPWYREPWPWILMAGPLAVVLAGIVTVWLAVATEDGVVADDYYKRGLAINQTIARDEIAAARGYRARVVANPAGDRLQIYLSGAPGAALPPAVRLRLVHPTRKGLDQSLELTTAGGYFEGAIAPLRPGRWLLVLEDREGRWRLTGEWQLPGGVEARLGPAAAAAGP